MTGAYNRDGGDIFLEGEPVNFRTPEDAQRAGVVAFTRKLIC
jgi:ribose transport system ATP-binding protein